MATIKVILIILEVLLLFNLLIGVHELGHFLAAKWRGLKIDRFAIWFGKPIWKRRIGGVEYALGWIPAGGYVSLPQMASMEAIEGKSETSEQPLPNISALDKIIVAFAGPLFSFLLAVAFAFVVWGVGRPVPAVESSTTIGWVSPNGPAWKSGLRPGDQILEIDGEPVSEFFSASRKSITWKIITSEGTNIAFKYLRDGQEHMAYAAPRREPTKWYQRKSFRQVLIAPARPAHVAQVLSNSPAAVAGLQPNDEIVAINDEKILAPDAVLYAEAMLTNGPLQPVKFTIRRGDQMFDRELMPEAPIQPTNAPPVFGVALWFGSTNETLVYPKPMEQIAESAGQIFATIGAVASPKSDIGLQQLGGAVMILRAYKNFFESENGWRRVLWFSVILNVNLALLNLLPFPVLDGGHITLALIEAVRRRPVSARLLQTIQSACAMVLIGFMLFIAFFDAGDWFRSARADRQSDEIVFSPKN
ncbi:MAG TPA: RIP metalloprotease RseP [Verrucomicrobiae bacterium]|nr:RIP metalloprotease RseP [Verrucomicrobiae bacterium]